MTLIYRAPCQYTGFIPYDYPSDFRWEWSIRQRISGLEEIYAQKVRSAYERQFKDYRDLERRTYLKSRFENFRDSVISAIRKSGNSQYEKIVAEDRVGELYERLLKGLGFIDEYGNMLPCFEPLVDGSDVMNYTPSNPAKAKTEELDLSRLSELSGWDCNIGGSFRKGFLREELSPAYS